MRDEVRKLHQNHKDTKSMLKTTNVVSLIYLVGMLVGICVYVVIMILYHRKKQKKIQAFFLAENQGYNRRGIH